MVGDVRQSAPDAFVRPALLQEPVVRDVGGPAGGKIRCLTCERRCEVAPGGVGWCQTRRHEGGELKTLIYGAVSSLSCNPIEKKPLYHFYPGTVALTSGSYSCNLDCPWCQNYHISKASPGGGRYVAPEDFVLEAVNRRCQGTSISLNEPTLSLEWSLDVFRLARERCLYNTFVSNGYMTPGALRLLVEAGLNAINVDIKGDARAVKDCCGIDVEKVWRNCRLAREAGVWLEVTTLVIPGVNDADEVLRNIANRIAVELGPEVPWHVSRYYPAYRFSAPPTPVRTLERAWHVGQEAGLGFIYVGNVPGTALGQYRLEHTYCPACGMLLIERWGLDVTGYHLERGLCPHCGQELPGVWADVVPGG